VGAVRQLDLKLRVCCVEWVPVLIGKEPSRALISTIRSLPSTSFRDSKRLNFHPDLDSDRGCDSSSR
jgi:hypothetical protein